MKKFNFKSLMCVAMALCIMASLAVPTFAADLGTGGLNGQQTTSSTIDPNMRGSVEIFKIDFTNAAKDGVWSGTSYVSTGVQDDYVEDTLINDAKPVGNDDGVAEYENGKKANGYAIQGVEFTYLKVANIVTYSEEGNIIVLYQFDDETDYEGLLDAIGVDSHDYYDVNDDLLAPPSADTVYVKSDVLQQKMKDALNKNATTVKDALEKHVKVNDDSKAMTLTDENGYTKAEDMDLGLYLFVETRVPEMVTSTTNPFFLSVPMTTNDGTNVGHADDVTDGGAVWLYDITLYPKNETGIPSFEKTVREFINDGGENNGSNTPDAGAIEDGFKHYATASAGDMLQYQILSTLPSITSDATALTMYNVTDTLGAGLTYERDSMVIEWFKDEACTQLIDTWEMRDDYFTVDFIPPVEKDESDVIMTIAFTDDGLAEINKSDAVWTEDGQVRRGFSDCTMRITYAATFDGNATAVFGDTGNCNKAVLTWKRSNTAYFDTLVDDAHVYSFGIDLTKVFASEAGNTGANGNMNEVEFVVWNNSDGYWVVAELNEAEGVYYVTDMHNANGQHGHTDGAAHADLTAQEAAEKGKATKFVPTEDGKIIIKGLEDDEYILTEVRTSDGYTLLKDHITVTISVKETDGICHIYDEDVLGVIQNDPRYASVVSNANVATTVLGLGGLTNEGASGINIPQKAMEHHLLTASAKVDGQDVSMLADDTSPNALAPLTVVNTRGFDLPQTGEVGAMLLPLVGVMGMCAIIAVLFILKKKEQQDVA